MLFIDLSKGKDGIIKCEDTENKLYDICMVRKNDIIKINGSNSQFDIYCKDNSDPRCKYECYTIHFNDNESMNKWLEKNLEDNKEKDKLIKIEKKLDDIENMIKYQPGGTEYFAAKKNFEKNVS